VLCYGHVMIILIKIDMTFVLYFYYSIYFST